MTKKIYMTVLIHGTWVPNDAWSQTNSDFAKFIQKEVFVTTPNKVELLDRATWNAFASVSARSRAVNEIIKHLKSLESAYSVDAFRLIGHSHGGTVANAVTHEMKNEGMQVRTLINLSTPCRFDVGESNWPRSIDGEIYPNSHLPLIADVEWKRFFHFHAESDGVVTNCPVTFMTACARQSFKGTSVESYETNDCRTGSGGHWLSTQPKEWRTQKWGQLVQDK